MNEDIYGLQASGIDPEIAAQMLGVKRRRDVALALQKQSMGGLSQTPTPAGGFAVRNHPLEAVAKIVQAYMANQGLESADKEQAKLTSDNQRKVADAMAMYEQKRAGTPAQPISDAGPGDNVDTSTVLNAQPGDPRKALSNILGSSPFMASNPLIKGDIGALEKASQPYTLPAGSQRFSADNKPLAQAGFKPAGPAKPPMTDFQIAQVREMIAKGADMGMDISGLQTELASALAAREALKSAAPTMPAAMPNAPAKPMAGQVPGEIQVPPEVVAAAARGPFTATQNSGQAPVINNLAPRDARALALDQGKSQVNINEARAKSNFDPTVQKEIIQTDEEMAAAKSGMVSLKKALELNDKAMGFPLAGAVATAGSFLPESIRPGAVDATQLLDNTLTTGALPQLRAIFGGNPTEGERKVLLDIQGSSSKPPAVRRQIIERAQEALNARIKVNESKSERLRSGEYFSPQRRESDKLGAPRVVDW